MHQFMRPRPLGGQQLHHLRQLREASDNEVRQHHLGHSRDVSASIYNTQQHLDSLSSRTVDAIVQERVQNRGNVSTSARLREKVAAARRGLHTECIERPGDELRPTEKIKTTRKIAAVRRRGTVYTEEERSVGRHRMGKQEAEWAEKQMQYKMRVATLEKECRAAWQSFFADAGASAPSTGLISAAELNKLIEEMDTLREEDVHKMENQLRKLGNIVNEVQVKVGEIANGAQFFTELQDRIEAMEAALAKFRMAQRQQFEAYVLEEKVLEKELVAHMEKMERWDNGTPPQLSRGGINSGSLGSRLTHLNSKSSLNSRYVLSSRGQGNNNNDDESRDYSSGNQGNQEEDRRVRIGTPDETGMVNRVRWLNEAILRSGGLKGGWDNREHATFTMLLVKFGLSDDVLLRHLSPENSETNALRHRTTNQDFYLEDKSQTSGRSDYETRVARFLRKCMRKVVTQTEISVRSHFEWYLRHLELVEEKKRVIHEWKKRKEDERQQIIQCGFEADGNVAEDLDCDRTPEASHEISSGRAKQKTRKKTERLLEQWKREKKQKEEEQEKRGREIQTKRDAVEAKRKQEQLDAKQKILMYKLQKEQEMMILNRATRLGQDSATDDGLPLGTVPFSSPTSKEDLVERSRIAIEYAKAKRLRLQQIGERKQKKLQLPPRPDPKATNKDGDTSPKRAMVLNATEASKARDYSKEEIRRKARRRERQSAHDAYIPGKRAIPDVKFKSFGHIPIQPRAVPAWRKNI